MGVFPMMCVGRLALIALLVSGCSAKTRPLAPAAAPDRPAPWPAAIINAQGQPRLEIVEPELPGAIELQPRHAMQSTSCILDGVAWELRQNHWGLISKDSARRELPLPAYPAHGPACNGKYLAMEADVEGASTLWVLDVTTGRQQRTTLPDSKPGYGAVFPVVNVRGELDYVLAVSYSGTILSVRGERMEPLPGGRIPIHSTVDVTQHGDSVLVHTDFVYVLSAADQTLRGTFDVGGRSVWVRPSNKAMRARPEIAAVDYHNPWAFPREDPGMVSPASLFDGDLATESLLSPGDHTLVIRFVLPVLDPTVQLTEALTSSGPRIVTARASGNSSFGTPVTRPDGGVFPAAGQTEERPPNLHQLISEVSLQLACGCSGNEASCEELCQVLEVGCH